MLVSEGVSMLKLQFDFPIRKTTNYNTNYNFSKLQSANFPKIFHPDFQCNISVSDDFHCSPLIMTDSSFNIDNLLDDLQALDTNDNIKVHQRRPSDSRSQDFQCKIDPPSPAYMPHPPPIKNKSPSGVSLRTYLFIQTNYSILFQRLFSKTLSYALQYFQNLV
jgi:hypothetical protein